MNLVLIVGDEPLLVDRALVAAERRALQREPETELRNALANEITAAGFADLVAPSLFAEPRLVVVRNSQDAIREVADSITAYLADPVDGVTLVVHHSGGARNKQLTDALVRAGAERVTCSRITRPAERVDFVRGEIAAAGGTTTTDAVAALVDAVGSDLRELAGAASQLVADTGGFVDDTAVHRYHRGRADVSGFTVADKVIAGDVPGALESARWAADVGVAQVLVADALADGVRTVARVAGFQRGGTAHAIAGQLGMPPWKVERAQRQARSWSAAALATAVDITARLNAEVKGVAADPDYAIEKAILDLGRARKLR